MSICAIYIFIDIVEQEAFQLGYDAGKVALTEMSVFLRRKNIVVIYYSRRDESYVITYM